MNHIESPQDSQTQVISKYTFLNSSDVYIYVYPLSSQSTKTNHFANIKHTYTNIRHTLHTQTSDTNFRRVSPFSTTPVKRAHKARTCWYRRPFCLIYRYQVKENKIKKRNEQTPYKKKFYKCIMANTSAIWQQAAHTTDQLSFPSCSTRAIQKSLTLNEKYLRVFWKKVRRMDH